MSIYPVPWKSFTMSQVLELAKQGDVSAIATLINRSLTPQGIKARIVLQDGTLKVLLESLEVPSQERFTRYIIQGLQKIGMPDATTLEIFGKQSGSEGFAWRQVFQVDGETMTPVQPQMSGHGAQCDPVQSDTVQSDTAQSDTAQSDTAQSDTAQSDTAQSDIAQNPTAQNPTPSSNLNGLDAATIQKMAKQGNIEAIAAFVKSALSDREGVESFVEMQSGVLKVTIETKQFLDGPAFCGEFGTKMNALAGGAIEDVEVYKRKSEKTAPFLMKKMTLFSKSVPDVSDSSSSLRTEDRRNSTEPQRPNGQSSAMRYTEAVHSYESSGSQGRPTGVLVVAILYFVFGSICTLIGGFTLIASLFLRAAMESAGGDAAALGMVGFVVFVMSGLLLLLGLARIWIGIGLLQMQAWARNWAIRLEGFSLMRSAFALIRGDFLGGIIGIGISVPIWYYLSQAGMGNRFH
jgi:hypothetical protein